MAPPRPKVLHALETSWLSRSLRASAAGAGMAARWAGGTAQRLVSSSEASERLRAVTQAAMAKRLAESLGQLKGLAMKAGQVASYMDFALPDAARAALAGLQDSTPPMAPAVVEKVVTEELGRPPRELFSDWSDRPIAAASIGQVHRARLPDGTDVAVKVQYPGIARTFESDLASASLLDTLGSAVARGQEKGTLLAELRERLLEECDYLIEARHQEEFRRLFADRDDLFVPAVFPAFSSRRVLTSRFVDGQRFAAFAAGASQAEKNRAGEAIWDAAMGSIFVHGVFNADPHPGNYLFVEGKVALLDFGCVKRFEPAFLDRWRRLCLAGTVGDRATFDRLVVEIGFAPDPSNYDFDYHYRMTRTIYEPWIAERFRFTPEFVASTWRALVVDNPNKFRLNLPRDFLFVNRIQWGLFSVLAALGAESSWRRRFLPLLGEEGLAALG